MKEIPIERRACLLNRIVATWGGIISLHDDWLKVYLFICGAWRKTEKKEKIDRLCKEAIMIDCTQVCRMNVLQKIETFSRTNYSPRYNIESSQIQLSHTTFSTEITLICYGFVFNSQCYLILSFYSYSTSIGCKYCKINVK